MVNADTADAVHVMGGGVNVDDCLDSVSEV